MSSKMIADRLCISEQTVKNHKRNMMEKTSAKNIVELINFSLKNNWL
jgi:DNA-binding NarL/FixJ family response regulator